MWFILRLLAVVGVLFIALIALAIVGLSRINVAGRAQVPIANASVLTLTVEGPFLEESPVQTGFAARFTPRAKKLRDIIAGIDRAAADSRVKGLILKIDASPGMAQTQELRAAIKRFRDGGKFASAFADDYGEGGVGNGEYYLAAACDEVWLQPMGEAMLTGVSFEQPFLKDAFAKLDIEPEFSKRAEYKSAPETYTERGFTPASREMMESLANDLTTQLVSDIAASRKLQPDQVHALFDRGPMTAVEASAAGLVDHVGYADEAVAGAKKAAGANARLVPLADYERATRPVIVAARPNIALIYEVGEIDRVAGPIDPAGGERDLAHENGVMRGFAKAMSTPSVRTIVFRVDSPGGSVSGSESIRRMVTRAKEAGKSVVVSMGATAASGGYWISVDADRIVADAATLTGSIGVFSGKFVVVKGLNDLGVAIDRTAAGPFANMDSPFAPFTQEQTQRLNATLDGIYTGFIARVAEGRKLPPGTVAQSAKGRVWTGQQAKQLGLVDEVGDLHDAVRIARDLGGIPADQPSRIAVYPEPLSPLETVRSLLSGESEMQGSADAAIDALDGPAGAALRALRPLFRMRHDDLARMPDLGLVK